MFIPLKNISGQACRMLLIVLSFCPLSFSHTLIADEPSSFLWEIHANDQKLGVLFGTFHVGTKESALPIKAVEHLNQTNQLITENIIVFQSDEEEYAMTFAAFSFFKPSGQSITERFSSKYAELLRSYLLSKGFPEAVQDTISNELLFIMLAVDIDEGYSPDFGVEMLIKQYVVQNNVNNDFENIGLETMIESLQLLRDAIADTVQLEIESFLDHRKIMQDYSRKMFSYYTENNVANFLKIVAELEQSTPMTEDHRVKNKAMMKKINTDRNHNWMKKLTPLLNSDGSHQHFIAVGALHLFGEEGLIELLRKAGFKVTPVLY